MTNYYNFSNTAPDFGAYVSPWVAASNDTHPGEPAFYELLETLREAEPTTALTDVFPEQVIPQRHVEIQQYIEGSDTIFPLVEPGKPDQVLGYNRGGRRKMTVDPLYIRASAFFDPSKINYMLKPGTVNELSNPDDEIVEQMSRMIREHNLTWDVFRAMMLLGGINYSDPRSGVGAKVMAQIPGHNLFNYKLERGYQGRPESSLFRSITDPYSTIDGNNNGVPWTHPDADIVGFIKRFKRWFKDTNKSEITDAYISAETWEVISMNNQFRLASGGMYQNPSDDMVLVGAQGFDSNAARAIQLDSNGMIVAIAGVRFHAVDTKYIDPTDGIWKRLWPKDKVVFVSRQDSQGRQDAPGRTQFCISENVGGEPGMWLRVQTDTQIPAAPGIYVQMGNAGLPYLRYPYRVAHVTVASVDDINARLGVIGDLGFGRF